MNNWTKMTEKFVDSDDAQYYGEGGHYKILRGEKFQKVQCDPLQLITKE